MSPTATSDDSKNDSLTAAEHLSDIQRFFEGSTVFITGATGFLGKLVLEKLLRTCKRIETIYILIREKKGKSVQQRYEELFHPVVFGEVKKEDPRLLDKVILMEGDCALPNLGLSEQNQQTLLNEVNCVFHCAATVRFNEKIRTATHTNVRATRDILMLSENMEKLKSFVYISTAYSACDTPEIKEEFYEPAITGDKLIALVDTLKDDILEEITPTLLGKWPNPYTFTKFIAEEVVKTYGKSSPVCVVRPSAVVNTIKEPVPGWIDNVYGPVGITSGFGVGLIRVINCDGNYLADLVPADYVVNCAIAASWDTSISYKTKLDKEDGNSTLDKCASRIYNCVSSPQNPMTWKQHRKSIIKYGQEIPTVLAIWYPFIIFARASFQYKILAFLLHTLPAYIVDIVIYFIGKKPRLVKGYKKIHTFIDVLTCFITREWIFNNENTQRLWKELTEEDKRLFEFDMRAFTWNDFAYKCVKGGRTYLLKDPFETVPQGRKKRVILQIIHYVLVAVISFGIFRLLKLFYEVLV